MGTPNEEGEVAEGYRTLLPTPLTRPIQAVAALRRETATGMPTSQHRYARSRYASPSIENSSGITGELVQVVDRVILEEDHQVGLGDLGIQVLRSADRLTTQ
jgi:hypothetical protein